MDVLRCFLGKQDFRFHPRFLDGLSHLIIDHRSSLRYFLPSWYPHMRTSLRPLKVRDGKNEGILAGGSFGRMQMHTWKT